MEYNDIKECMRRCPDLAGLEEGTVAELFWRGKSQIFEAGEVIYPEGSELDGTLGLLVSGDLIVEKGGVILGGITEQQLFGEMAYFTSRKTRTATIRVGSPEAMVVMFQLTPDELRSQRFSALRKNLAIQTWDKFVSTSQSFGPLEELCLAGC